MQFKDGMGWKACCDESRDLYTAETGGPGAYDLYEITKEIYDTLGAKGTTDSDAQSLIHTGRHLYMDVNDRCGPPYTVVLDSDYRELCPWASVSCSGTVLPDALTDAAVELFASEEQNRAQRRRKREQRNEEQASSAQITSEQKSITTQGGTCDGNGESADR